MSLFEVRIRTVAGISEHDNADALEIATLDDGSRSVVQKDLYQVGERVVAFPEHAILPDDLLQTLGLWKNGKGVLAGSKGNRVKPIRLRGEISETVLCKPIVLNVDADCEENLTAVLGVEKFQPKIPQIMNGKLRNAYGHTIHFDIENYRKFQNDEVQTFKQDEPVVITEKMHGTFCAMGWDREYAGDIVSSKGVADKGMCFDLEESDNERNLYVQAYRKHFDAIHRDENDNIGISSFHVLGEIVGPGIQDYHYDFDSRRFLVFDVKIDRRWLPQNELEVFCSERGFDMVPVVVQAEFRQELVATTVKRAAEWSTHHKQLEGVVVASADRTRRLKWVLDDFKGRKGGTEFQ
ncbi:MAG: RNA ligase (ATP) [Gammaproteobacteria bacterium]|nr:RNA ligase (ATP) [Gammaproteobacteria bacterium]